MSIDQSFSFSTQLLPLNISKVAEELIVFVFVELKIGMRIQKIFLSFPFFSSSRFFIFLLFFIAGTKKKRNLHVLNVFNVKFGQFQIPGKKLKFNRTFQSFYTLDLKENLIF